MVVPILHISNSLSNTGFATRIDLWRKAYIEGMETNVLLPKF